MFCVCEHIYIYMNIYYYFSLSPSPTLCFSLPFCIFPSVSAFVSGSFFISSQYFKLDNFNCSEMVSLIISSKSHTFCQFPIFSFCFLLSALFASFSIKGVMKLLSSSLPSPLHMFMWSCQPFFSPSQCLVDFVLCVLVILFDPPCPFLSLLPSF